MLVESGGKGTRVLERAGEGVMVLGLTVDAGGGGVDVVEVAFELRARLVLGGKKVVRFKELLVFNDLGGVTIDRGVFVCANVPDGRGGSIRCSGGGKRSGLETDVDFTVELGHGSLDAVDHLVNTGRKEFDR